MAGIDKLKLLGNLLGSGAISRGSGANALQSVMGAAMGGGEGQSGISGLLGSVLGGSEASESEETQGGMGGLLGSVLGGSEAEAGEESEEAQGGLGGMLGSMLGGNDSEETQGGLGGMLGSVLGGGNEEEAQGGIGGLLGSVLGGAQESGESGLSQLSQGAGVAGLLGATGLGGLLGAAMGQYGQSQEADAEATSAESCSHLPEGVSHEQASDQASLMLKAMINTAKADGHLDAKEEQAILGQLGEATQEELDFIREELAQPLDVDAFIQSIPRGLEQQVYTVSLMAIDLDSKAEAEYLDKLAQGIGINHEESNQIHKQMGVPILYS